MPHVRWLDQAESLIAGNWGREGSNATKHIQEDGDQRLAICLLIDIAKSLRVLRCQNFIDIPTRLNVIAHGLDNVRRDMARHAAKTKKKAAARR